MFQVTSVSGFVYYPPIVRPDEARSPQQTNMSYEKTIVVSCCTVSDTCTVVADLV